MITIAGALHPTSTYMKTCRILWKGKHGRYACQAAAMLIDVLGAELLAEVMGFRKRRR